MNHHRLMCFLISLPAVAIALPATPCYAKSPQLPVPFEIICTPGLGETSGSPVTPGQEVPAVVTDGWVTGLFPVPRNFTQHVELRQLSSLAQQHMDKGDIEPAWRVLREIYQRGPNSRHGQQALSKMRDIEHRWQLQGITFPRLTSGRQPATISRQDGIVPATDIVRQPTRRPRQARSARKANVVKPARVYLHNLGKAQKAYRLGMRHVSKGEYDKACHHYEQTIRYCPNSDYARRAKRYLQRVELLRELNGSTSKTKETPYKLTFPVSIWGAGQ